MDLKVGETHEVEVRARPRWTDTAVDVRPGQVYRFKADGCWTDLIYPSGPEGNRNPNWIMRRSMKRLRVPKARYMTLIAAIDKDQSDPIILGGGTLDWTAERAGRLYCFANDVPGFYWNNWGAVTLEVLRLPDPAA